MTSLHLFVGSSITAAQYVDDVLKTTLLYGGPSTRIFSARQLLLVELWIFSKDRCLGCDEDDTVHFEPSFTESADSYSTK